MSYARFVTPAIQRHREDIGFGVPQLSDVYVFMSYLNYLECCGCSFADRDSFDSYVDESQHYSTQSMIDHLKRHREAGHHVPDGIEEALWDDDKENFPDEAGPADSAAGDSTTD